MKRKKNYLIILIIVILLILAYLLPTLISAAEDRRLRYQSKKFQIEEITLDAGNDNLTEKLSAIQYLLQDGVVMQNDKGEQGLQESVVMQGNIEEEINEIIADFLTSILDTSEIKIIKSGMASLVLTDKKTNKVYSLWECTVVYDEEQKGIFYVDDESRKILAFEIPYFTGEVDKELCHKLVQVLAEYYGYTGGKMEGDLSEFLRTQGDSDFSKYFYQSNSIRFLCDEEETALELLFYKNGKQLSFNMYPSRISVDYKEASSTD